MAKVSGSRSPFIRFLFLVYCGTMLWLLFGRSYGWIDGLSYKQMLLQNTNLTPFLTVKNYWTVIIAGKNEGMIRHCIINLGGNIFLFIPAGWLLPKIWARLRNYFRFLAVCTMSIFLVEILQLFTLLGCFDVDDLILNLFGMTLGFIYYHLTNRPKKL